jgi:hypothetical protein
MFNNKLNIAKKIIFEKINKSNNINNKFINEENNFKIKINKNDDDIKFTAFIDNEEVGTLYITIIYQAYEYEFSDYFTEDEFDEMFSSDMIPTITHLEINDNNKYSGIGTQLMNKALTYLKTKGFKEFYLNASPMGSTGLDLSSLVNFYKKFGFKVILNQGNNVLMAITKNNKLNEQRIITKNKKQINEERLNGKTIINVDIQPEYKSYITFNLNEWVKFINNSAALNNIVFLYNGADTLGMISESDYYMWLSELGIEEDVLNNATFYDKGYAFFRYCIDNNIDENNIIDLIKFMIKNNINDSRDIDEEMWNNFMEDTNHTKSEVRDLLENADDMINIPDLMDFLQNYSNIVLTGGGINECLKEVELALLALNKNFNILSKFTY